MAMLGSDPQSFPASADKEKLTSIDFGSLISLIPENIIDHYREDQAIRASVVELLRQVRKQIAEVWLVTLEDQLEDTYFSDVGKVHQMLLNSGIKAELLTDIEQDLVKQLTARITKGFDEPKAIHYLLVAMLYCPAYQLPLQYELAPIPQWFLDDYIEYMLYRPHFKEVGEVDCYYHHIKQLLDCTHASIFNNQNVEFWQYVASIFAQELDFIGLYFNTENLKSIFSKRADITEFSLKNSGYQVDYAFSERPTNRKKILLGMLVRQLTPDAETYNLVPILEHLDRDKFEIIVYVPNIINHPLEQYCQNYVERLVKLSGDLYSQVQTIRADNLDILHICSIVSNYNDNFSLLALHRLARIQTTYFVSPITTGMRNVDYYISGSLSEPEEGAQEHYRERLIKLDGTGFCYNFTTELDAPTIKPDRKSIRVPDKSIVFISGASFEKIMPELQETWAKIIAAMPNAVMVLYPFSPVWSQKYPEQYHKTLTATFARHGVEEKRLIMLKIKGRSNVRECLKLADVYLDSYPYSGATSALEALDVGLPIVAREGNALRSRAGAALLRDLQMPELIADSEEAYIQLATVLGTDPDLRQQKSEQIQQKMQQSPGFLNGRSYAAQLGALFQDISRNHFQDLESR